MALVMTESGHVALALALSRQEFWLALGGLPEGYENPWRVEEEPPAFDPQAGGLLEVYGYRRSARRAFAREDENGLIVAAGRRWSIADTPTRHLYLEFRLDPEDAAGKTVYQVGIFLGLIPKPEVPEGKLFLLPQEVADAGVLFMAENLRPFHRHEGVREVFEFVLTF